MYVTFLDPRAHGRDIEGVIVSGSLKAKLMSYSFEMSCCPWGAIMFCVHNA